MALPKYLNDKDYHLNDASTRDWESLQDNMAVNASANDTKNLNYIDSLKRAINKNVPFLQRVYNKFHHIDLVEETFEKVKNSTGVIGKDLIDSYDAVNKLIDRSKNSNQSALAERLFECKHIIAQEMLLAKNGFDKFVTEDNIIKFFKECNKAVRIDFIRNYSTLIPFKVAEKKEFLDKLGIFDNYVVMHYDPTGSAFKESKLDIKDPILFGLIKGSTKLYFVADWITEDDDLTLEELNIVVNNATSRLSEFKIESDEIIEEFMNNIQTLSNNLSKASNDD